MDHTIRETGGIGRDQLIALITIAYIIIRTNFGDFMAKLLQRTNCVRLPFIQMPKGCDNIGWDSVIYFMETFKKAAAVFFKLSHGRMSDPIVHAKGYCNQIGFMRIGSQYAFVKGSAADSKIPKLHAKRAGQQDRIGTIWILHSHTLCDRITKGEQHPPLRWHRLYKAGIYQFDRPKLQLNQVWQEQLDMMRAPVK